MRRNKNSRWLKKRVIWAFIAVTLTAGLTVLYHNPTEADGPLTFTELGEHPQAAAQPTTLGQTIDAVTVFNNKVYAGYGDYGANTGPIDINPYDLGTGSFTGSEISLPTEHVGIFREFGGKLYAPLIDPDGSQDGGYGVGEPWSLKQTVTGSPFHTFDITTLDGSDLWMSGSTPDGDGGAALWHSEDDGDTWSIEQTESEGRYYWVVEMGNKIYAQPVVTATGAPLGPVDIYDGSSWTTGTTDMIARSDKHPIVFDDNIITTARGLSVYDGTTVAAADPLPCNAKDYTVDDEYLYVLCDDDRIARTTDLDSWQYLGEAPSNATAIDVADERIYIGTQFSLLYQSEEDSLPDPPTLAITSPADGSTVDGDVTISADVGSSDLVTSVKFYRDSTLLTTDTEAPYTYDWNTANLFDGNYTIKAELEDAYGNTLEETADVTVANHPDTDGDGVSDNVENGAPNNGDGNNDGTTDAQQSSVVSLDNPISGKYATLIATGDCDQFQGVFLNQNESVTLKAGQSALAHITYTLVCDSPGQMAHVTFLLDKKYSPGKIVLKKQQGAIVLPITPYATVTTATQPSRKISKIILPITDGGAFDTDGAVNGTITDPLLIAFDASVGGGIDSTSSGDLADTGLSQTAFIAVALLVMISASGLLVYRFVLR